MGGMSGMRKWWRMGILLGALCAAAGCGRPPLPSSAAPEEKTGVRVSGAAALEEVRRFVELGPKEPGTEGAARAEGARNHFGLYPGMISDDHTAFLERGVPAMDLIDFYFGSAPGKNDYWHTAQDSMDKVSAESLEKVGRVTARMVEALVQREVAAKK